MNSQSQIPNSENRSKGKGRIYALLLAAFLMVARDDPFAHDLPPAENPDGQSGRAFSLRVDVDLVTTEVVVLDGKGNPVHNLQKEDFRLYEDGKRQEILSFDEIRGDANIPPSAMPVIDGGDMPRGKTVLILFSGLSMPQSQVQKLSNSAVRFVREHMQPQDLFAVASWGGSMRINQNLTDDKEAVIAAVKQAARDQGWGLFGGFLESLEQINDSIASIKGQKSVLIFGSPGSVYGLNISDPYYTALSSARKANVIYFLIDPGLKILKASMPPEYIETPAPSGDSETTGRPKVLPGRGTIPEYDMRSFASSSGGSVITGMDAIDVHLDQLNQRISNYYILGFQSSNQKHDGAYRKVKVTTDLKGAMLKYQPGYQDRRPIDVLPSSRQEQMLLAALAAPNSAGQLPIEFRPSYFYEASGPARVLIAARIRTDRMALKKKDDQIGTDLNIMGAAYAENGSIAARFNEILPVVLDKAKEFEFRQQDLPYRSYLRLRPGKYRLKLAVSDDANSLGSMEQNLELPERPGQGFACSSLVVSEQLSKMPGAIDYLNAQLLNHADPLFYAGAQIQPSANNRLPVNSAISVLFRMYDLPCRIEDCRLTADPKLMGERGEQFSLPAIGLKDMMHSSGPSEAVVGLRMPFQNVPSGKYRMVLEVKEAGSAQSATLQTDLEFVSP